MCGFGDEWFSVDDSDLNIKEFPFLKKYFIESLGPSNGPRLAVSTPDISLFGGHCGLQKTTC